MDGHTYELGIFLIIKAKKQKNIKQNMDYALIMNGNKVYGLDKIDNRWMFFTQKWQTLTPVWCNMHEHKKNMDIFYPKITQQSEICDKIN